MERNMLFCNKSEGKERRGRKNGLALLQAVFLGLLLAGCEDGGKGIAAERPPVATAREAGTNRQTDEKEARTETTALFGGTGALPSLEQFAELERSGTYTQGMGLAESALRENSGDYAGAVLAAYKELSWAYGRGLIEKEALETGVKNVLALEGSAGEEDAVQAARGILAFMRERWGEAGEILRSLFDGDEDPDGFARWMILACALEQDRNNRKAAAAYSAIRARCGNFPEYWYRGARFFTGPAAVEYAEQCISQVPAGPYAGACRTVLASASGLKPEDGAALKSKKEIETLVSHSISREDPRLLEELMPLIALPENPYTVYAVGALRALAALPRYRDYFSDLASRSAGRLAERLAYICRG
jgi:hypothetical protein